MPIKDDDEGHLTTKSNEGYDTTRGYGGDRGWRSISALVAHRLLRTIGMAWRSRYGWRWIDIELLRKSECVCGKPEGE